jgi:hypothetical protein
LIYSEPFEALPAEAKALVFQRLWTILSGQEEGDRYAKLTPALRQDVLEILRSTKKDLPPYFFGAGY